MAVKGKTISIGAPELSGSLKGIFGGCHWSLTFQCGSCTVKSRVQHDENKNYHKCPVCGEINLLKETSWYDL